MARLRVLIADSGSLVRTGIRALVDSQPSLITVGEADSVSEAINKADALNADVLLINTEMTGGSPTFPEAVAACCPTVRIVIGTLHRDAAYLEAMLSSTERMLRDVLRPHRMTSIWTFGPEPSGDTAVPTAHIRPAGKTRPETRKISPQLSARELQVVQLLAEGYTSREIAQKIFRSTKTVEAYRSALRRKLSARNRAEIVRYAREMGILKSDEAAKERTS